MLTFTGAIITPIAPEVGVPVAGAGTVLSTAGTVMQVAEDAIKGDTDKIVKTVVSNVVSKGAVRPLRKAIGNADLDDVSKVILNQQTTLGQKAVKKTLDAKFEF